MTGLCRSALLLTFILLPAFALWPLQGAMAQSCTAPLPCAQEALKAAQMAQKTAAGLQAQIDSLKKQLAQRHVESGEIVMSSEDSGAKTACTPGQEGFRGEAGRITFGEPFATSPTVTGGLTYLDTASRPRIVFEIVSIDKTGFYYRLQTWCDSKVFEARADWLAISR